MAPPCVTVWKLFALPLKAVPSGVRIFKSNAFILRIFYKGMQAKSLFSKYICMGVGLMFLIQSSINIGALLGLAPITGVPLPFISYGGSSYIVSSVAVALVLYAIESDKR